MFLVIGLAILFSILTILNTNQLISLKNHTHLKNLNIYTRLLITIPVLSLIILLIVIYKFHSLYETRFYHALLILSNWLVVANSIFIYKNISDKNRNIFRVKLLTLSSIATVIYITPINRYENVFNDEQYYISLIISLSLIIIEFINLARIRRNFSKDIGQG
ncbi:hypothetical protein C1N90_27475 (plasmid) [Priestia aryabhattai]